MEEHPKEALARRLVENLTLSSISLTWTSSSQTARPMTRRVFCRGIACPLPLGSDLFCEGHAV